MLEVVTVNCCVICFCWSQEVPLLWQMALAEEDVFQDSVRSGEVGFVICSVTGSRKATDLRAVTKEKEE